MANTNEEIAGKNSEKFVEVKGFGESRISALIGGFKEAREALKGAAEGETKGFEDTVRTLAKTLIDVLDYKYSLLAAAKEDPKARDWNNKTIDKAETEAFIESIEEALGIDLEVTDDEVYGALKMLKESGEIDIDNVDASVVNDAMDILEDAKNEREFALKRFAFYEYENDEKMDRTRKVLNDINEEGTAVKKPGQVVVSEKLILADGGVEIIPPRREKRVGPVIPSNATIDIEAEILDDGHEEVLDEKTKKSLKGQVDGILSDIPKRKEKAEEYETMSDKIKEYSEMAQGEITAALREEINAFIKEYKPRLKALRDEAVAKKSNSNILNVFSEDFERLGNLFFKINPEEKDDRKIPKIRKSKLLKKNEVSKETDLSENSGEGTDLPAEEQGSKPEAEESRHEDETAEETGRDFIPNNDEKYGDLDHKTKSRVLKTRKPQPTPGQIQEKENLEKSQKRKADAYKKAEREIEKEWVTDPNDFDLLKKNMGLYYKFITFIQNRNNKIESGRTKEDLEAGMTKFMLRFARDFKEYKEASLAKNENSDTTPEPAPEPVPEPTTLPIEQIFIMKKGEAYTKISEDKEFDGWMKSLYRQMVENNEADQDNARDIEAWHQEYVESAEHRGRLMEIFTDIQNSPDKMDVEISREKIQSLLYDLYRKSDETREKIDAIHASYQKSKENSKIKELEDKILSMKIEIGNDRQTNRNGELKPEQIKTILESRGDENTSENITKLSFFLKNLDNQYDMYMGGKKEGESNGMIKVYRRYTAGGDEVGEKKTGLGSKIGSFFSNMFTKFVATIPMSMDYKKYNEFAILVDQVRKLNLVDRKTGNKDAAAHNKHKMENLLNLMRNEKGLLQTYATNPQSIDLTTLSAEKKDLLETFKTMYDKYTAVKYRSDEGKQRAESILQYKPGSISSISREDILSPVDVLFDTSAEKETFKSVAKYEITKKNLLALEKEIESFPKGKTDNKKVGELEQRFNAIEKELNAAPEKKDIDKITLSTVSIKLKDLILRRKNTENPAELSESLKIYDEVLFSPVIDKAERINYVNTLIASLEQQKKSKGNTLIQTAIINDTIEKYKEIREQINK